MRVWSLAIFIALCGLGIVWADDEPAETKLVDVKAGELVLSVPDAWKLGEPSSKFRLAQLEVPAAEGDSEAGEYVVFHFGKGGGGGVNANVTRWINQFESEGRTVKVYLGESEKGKYALVDVIGTYNKPIGPPIQMKSEKMPGARMLGVVLQDMAAGDYFIKFTGPEKTVEEATANFRKSFGGDAENEKEQKPKAAAE